jgi:hypothetical protein
VKTKTHRCRSSCAAPPPKDAPAPGSGRRLTTLAAAAAVLTIVPLLLASDLRVAPALGGAELPSLYVLLSLASL